MKQDDDQTQDTEIALLRRDFEYLGKGFDKLERSLDGLRDDLRHLYYTKEQAANLRSELMTAHNALASQFKAWKQWIGAVGIIVVASLILELLKARTHGL
jgi:hypothetical protein